MEFLVAKRDLTLAPSAAAVEHDVSGLNAAIADWGASTDWRRVAIDPATDGTGEITVRLTDKRGRTEVFRYRAEGGHPIPIEPRVIARPGTGVQG